tara:strand:- start:1403 stop:1537 length:135 start_codon:yes stop_codon:yes gene_type:complete
MIPIPKPSFDGVISYAALVAGVTLGFAVADLFMPQLGAAISRKE